jgi:hypothetical protein
LSSNLNLPKNTGAETNGEANGATANQEWKTSEGFSRRSLKLTRNGHLPNAHLVLPYSNWSPGLRKAGKPSGDFVRLLTEYWERFSLKPVVVEDLLDFVKALEGEERAQWDAFVDAIPEDVVSSQLSCPMLLT